MTQTEGCEPEQLLASARAGDELALGRLLERYRNYLSLLARFHLRRRLQSKLDASDLVQEAFLGASRDFRQFRGDSDRAFTAWLRQILANVLANMVRHYEGTKQRDVRLEKRLEEQLEQSSVAMAAALVAPEASPSQHASRRELAVLLAEALESLAPEERELLILRHFEGLTFNVVAERLGRTLDSVKKMWPRALTRLRRAIKEKWNGSESGAC
jgi:RNA polymerase sigma-70 factor (ECF subfamily)